MMQYHNLEQCFDKHCILRNHMKLTYDQKNLTYDIQYCVKPHHSIHGYLRSLEKNLISFIINSLPTQCKQKLKFSISRVYVCAGHPDHRQRHHCRKQANKSQSQRNVGLREEMYSFGCLSNFPTRLQAVIILFLFILGSMCVFNI